MSKNQLINNMTERGETSSPRKSIGGALNLRFLWEYSEKIYNL